MRKEGTAETNPRSKYSNSVKFCQVANEIRDRQNRGEENKREKKRNLVKLEWNNNA